MPSVFRNMLTIIKNNIALLALAVIAFELTAWATLPYQVECLAVMVLSLFLYMRLLNQKKISFKTLMKYMAIYIVAYVVYLLIVGVLGMGFTMATLTLAFYFPRFETLLYWQRDFELNLLFGTIIGGYFLARIRLLLPFVLTSKEASLKDLIKKSSVGCFKLLGFALIFYTPLLLDEYLIIKSYMAEQYMIRGIMQQFLLAITIPLICIFNVAFYTSK